ncbi:sodium:calcium antiporter [Ktedonosporobacter rubrisoli]|uniref:Sodium:calcium antiporter n=1 Tax=Ktedonosporobacter rubrisoli TaxID=2509675 RepID=A0A4P6K555_KTERU|nr:sodium:calcium antiporter [Ktedonosporobacter rubrisoli]QBD83073.1 sodium:calcium antiporter [Ktedonosporobacter rubrisoli]
MAVALDLTLLLVSTVLLLYGTDWFIDGVRDLAQDFGISPLVLGIILVGLEPEEMLIAALASGQGAGSVAVGNVIGTNVTITTFALGLSVLITPIILAPGIRRQALIATGVSILPLAWLLLGNIDRVAGLLFLALFVGYTFLLFRMDRKSFERLAHSEELLENDGDEDEEDTHQSGKKRLWPVLLRTGSGLLMMAGGGFILVKGAVLLAGSLGLTTYAVSTTVVSLSTGAEMIILGITAARKQLGEILIGGILGSFAYNLLVTLGLAAVIRPLPTIPQSYQATVWIMIATHLLLLSLIWRGKISRVAGGILLIIYVAYIVSIILLR